MDNISNMFISLKKVKYLNLSNFSFAKIKLTKISESKKNEIIKNIMRSTPDYPKWSDNNFVLQEKK